MIPPVHRLKKTEITWLARHRCKHGMPYLEHYSCYVKEHPETQRVGVLDIETSGLEPRYSYMLSYAIKVFGKRKYFTGRINSQEIRNDKHDQRILKKLIKDLAQFDHLITYYGTWFDLPYLRTQALYYKSMDPSFPEFPVFGELTHKDLYFVVKRKLRFAYRRLGVVCDYFNIAAKNHPMRPKVWKRAIRGDKKAIDYVMTHNIEDVNSTEKLYNLIIDYGSPAKPSI